MIIEDYMHFEARSLSNLSIKKFQKQKIMKELLRAFPTIHQERKLTSLEKGRMTVQVLEDCWRQTSMNLPQDERGNKFATIQSPVKGALKK